MIVLEGGAVYDIWQEDVMRLQNFVESGGRLVVGADAFFRQLRRRSEQDCSHIRV